MPSYHWSTKSLINIAYNGTNLFVSVGSYNYDGLPQNALSGYSSDGISWTVVDGDVGRTYYSIAYGSGVFVAVGFTSEVGADGSGLIATTTDGITFTRRTTAGPYTTGAFVDIIFDGTRFVTISSSGEVQVSTDGINWTQKRADDSTVMCKISYIRNKYIIATGSADIIVSDDLDTYESITTNVGGSLVDIYQVIDTGEQKNIKQIYDTEISPALYSISSNDLPAIFGRGLATGPGGYFIGGENNFGLAAVGYGNAISAQGGTESGDGYGVWAKSVDSVAIFAETTGDGDAIHGNSTYGHGIVAESDTSFPEKSAFRIVPQDNAPTSGAIGDIYVSTAGKLYICTDPSPTWTLVGGQT